MKRVPGSKSKPSKTTAAAEKWLTDNIGKKMSLVTDKIEVDCRQKPSEKVITRKLVQKRSTRSLADRIQVDETAEIEAVEPPFSTFLRGTFPPNCSLMSMLRIDSTSPSLPSLGDPELFDKVFLQAHSSQQFQVMRHFGDSLLRATTFDVLTDVLGKSNYSAIIDTVSMVVSNAFYESLFLHYGLADLCVGFDIEVGNAKAGKSWSEKRGDILEAYFAGIDMDFSREGTGSKEVRDWLFQVLALRLGPQHKSPSTRKHLRNGRRGNLIWWESSKADWPEDLASRGLPKRKDGISDAQDKLNDFRDEIFEHMKLMVKEIYSKLPSNVANWGPAETHEFWEEMRRYFDAKISLKEYTEDHERILLYYYQVPKLTISNVPQTISPSIP